MFMMMTPSLDQTVCADQALGAGVWLITSVKRWGWLGRFQVRQLDGMTSGAHYGFQGQQLIVWRFLQPRSQLIKVFAAGQADEQTFWSLAQQTI